VDSGRRDEALIEFRRPLEPQPDNIRVRHQMRRLTSVMVPFWPAAGEVKIALKTI
jgi:type II protein arginine methyltransferase